MTIVGISFFSFKSGPPGVEKKIQFFRTKSQASLENGSRDQVELICLISDGPWAY